MPFKQIKRGDIYFADLNPVLGSEQCGVRPVVIIQNDRGNRYSPTVIVAAVTSRPDKREIPIHVHLYGYGLQGYSVVLLEQIRTIDRMRLRSYIGYLSTYAMQQNDQALAISLKLLAPN